MDTGKLIRVVTQRWWLVLPIFVIAFGSAVVFTLGLPPRYLSRVTYVVRPSPVEGQDPLDAVALLSRTTGITSTYAEVAGSRQVRNQAAAAAQLSGGQVGDLSVDPLVVPGSNVIEIKVLGPDPQLARDFAEALGAATASYTQGVYGGLQLVPLDAASLADKPVEPNVPLGILLGGLVAAVLAVGSAFALELLRGPRSVAPTVSITDASGAYSEAYLTLRLSEELSRSQRTGRPFSLALMDVDPENALREGTATERQEVHRMLLTILGEHLRPEEVLARVGENIFAFLLPDRDRQTAISLMESLRARARFPISDAAGQAFTGRVDPTIGGVTARGGEPGPAALVKLADEALTQARATDSEIPIWFTLTSESAGTEQRGPADGAMVPANGLVADQEVLQHTAVVGPEG